MEKITKNLNVVILGHVNSGKSTMFGHLLYKLGVVDDTTMEENTKESVELNKQGSKYSWILEKLKKERERREPIDTSFLKFYQPK